MKRNFAFIIATIVVCVSLLPMTHIEDTTALEESPSFSSSSSQDNAENSRFNLTSWHLSEGDYIQYSNYGNDYFELLNNSGHSPELTSSYFQVNVLEDKPCNFGGTDAICHVISHTARANITWYNIDNHHDDHDDHDEDVSENEDDEYATMIIDMIEWNQTTQIYTDFSASHVDFNQKFSMWEFDIDTGDLFHESIYWENETHLSFITGMPEYITVGSQWIEEIESTISYSYQDSHGHDDSDNWQQSDNISYTVTEELEIELPPNQATSSQKNVSMTLFAIEVDDGENIVNQVANDFFKYKYFNFELTHNNTNTQHNSTGKNGNDNHDSHGENDADPECGDSSILYNHVTGEFYTKQDVIDGNAENWILVDENDFPNFNHPAYYNVTVHQVLDCTYYSQVGDWVLANEVSSYNHANYYSYTGLVVDSWHISAYIPDDDGDGLNNSVDQCPDGQIDWMSNSETDFDGDGCRDIDEDEDDDNDGFSDIRENECLSNPLNSTSIPLDNDGTGECDALDDDDDDDGTLDVDDAFPFDSSESKDNDADGIGDNADFDDDNDSFLDSEEIRCLSDPYDNLSIPNDLDQDLLCDILDSDDDGDSYSDDFETECESDNMNATSVPKDTDNDGNCNFLDSDDDNDGWLDITEISCLSDHLNSQSMPSDLDEDGVCDEFDTDLDGDGVNNSEDAFPLNPNKSSDSVAGGQDDSSGITYIVAAAVIFGLLVVILTLRRRGLSKGYENEMTQVEVEQEYVRFVDENGTHWLRKSNGNLLWWNGSEWIEYHN